MHTCICRAGISSSTESEEFLWQISSSSVEWELEILPYTCYKKYIVSVSSTNICVNLVMWEKSYTVNIYKRDVISQRYYLSLNQYLLVISVNIKLYNISI